MTRMVYFIWFPWNEIIKPQRRGELYVAICSETLRAAKIAKGALEVLIIRDAFLTSDGGGEVCEEALRCLDLRCSLNKTTWESLMKNYGIKRAQPPKAGFIAGHGLNSLEFPHLASVFEKLLQGGICIENINSHP